MRRGWSCGLRALLVAATATLASRLARADEIVKPPVVRTHVDAIYPPSAVAANAHADVVLVVTIAADGTVAHVDVAGSAGPELDGAAIAAVRRWTFEPATRRGIPVASRIRVPFHFAPPEALMTSPAGTPSQPGATVTPVPGSSVVVSGSAPSGMVEEVRVDGRRVEPSRGQSDFRIPRAVLQAAPHATGADLLATAPGIYVAHPEGEAIAQRIYLRGFDAEHGQDIELRVAGIPMNQPSHIHGQGYADLNLVIPEAVRSLRVVEGVYDPHQGDFAVAGSVDYELGIEERRSRVKATLGSFGTKRLVALWAPAEQPEETFGAAMLRTTDGFGDGTRGAVSGAVLGQYRFSLGSVGSATIHIGAHGARANVAGVVRRDDVDAGRIGFYDAYGDPSARAQSAATSRTQVGLSFERPSSDGATTMAHLWAYLASYRSRTNFTGYTERSRVEPTWVGRGDLVEQSNSDLGLGGAASHRSARVRPLSWLSAQYELGAGVRTDWIEQAQNLLRAPQNETWDRRDDAAVRQTDLYAYADALLAIKGLRLRGGPRADLLYFDVDDRLGNFTPAFSKKTHLPGFRRTASGIAFGPRASVEGDPAGWLRLSASYGEGYRSPQARQLEEGEQAPFAKVKSYEAGATLRDGDRVSFTAAAYETDLSYDLAFDPGSARVERIGPTTRRGLVGHVLANPTSGSTVSLSATYVQATLDAPPLPTPENPSPPYVSGQVLPYVPPLVVRSDVALTGRLARVAGEEVSWKLGYGTTFLSPRPLAYGDRSPAVFLLDASAGLRRSWLELTLDATNLLDARYADTEYSFVSNWLTGPLPSRLPARHVAAGPPRMLMFSATVYL
jgi:TonB family protein